MAEKIYLVGADNKLTAMEEQGHLTEDAFQKLLEDYPDILAGDQMNRESPRRWLLVTRELGVPGEEGGGNRWSLDHLFLDQDGVPTLVEVKRSTDTRLRREVVGQMLDYAANGIVYWPVESIREAFVARCVATGKTADEELAEFLGYDRTEVESPEDAFWAMVSMNLKAGKVRMVFFADFIPPELRRIVEFLNEQMKPAEVLAVEVKQFVDLEGKIKTLVPRVIGLTSAAETAKGIRSDPRKRWDEESFLQ